MAILTLGWVSLLVVFTWSIAMVVWGVTDYRSIVESPFLSILALFAVALLVAVTGGVGYLTLADWRDRRLRENEKRETKRSTPKRK